MVDTFTAKNWASARGAPFKPLSALDLDLEALERRLLHRFQWLPRKVSLLSSQYKRFLFIAQTLQFCGSPYEKDLLNSGRCPQAFYQRLIKVVADFGGAPSISPSLGIDEFWHMHILDTAVYLRDSHDLFGRFFHHAPGDGREVSQKHHHGFSLFSQLYELCFQSPVQDFSPSLKDGLTWVRSRLFSKNP